MAVTIEKFSFDEAKQIGGLELKISGAINYKIDVCGVQNRLVVVCTDADHKSFVTSIDKVFSSNRQDFLPKFLDPDLSEVREKMKAFIGQCLKLKILTKSYKQYSSTSDIFDKKPEESKAPDHATTMKVAHLLLDAKKEIAGLVQNEMVKNLGHVPKTREELTQFSCLFTAAVSKMAQLHDMPLYEIAKDAEAHALLEEDNVLKISLRS